MRVVGFLVATVARYLTMRLMEQRLVGDMTMSIWRMSGSPRLNYCLRRKLRREKEIEKDKLGD